MSKWGKRTQANVEHGVGGSFDVLAGRTRRAPAWCQDLGLGWLYKARQKPARLGSRYISTNMTFIALVVRELMQQARLRDARASEHGARLEDIPPWHGPLQQADPGAPGAGLAAERTAPEPTGARGERV